MVLDEEGCDNSVDGLALRILAWGGGGAFWQVLRAPDRLQRRRMLVNFIITPWSPSLSVSAPGLCESWEVVPRQAGVANKVVTLPARCRTTVSRQVPEVPEGYANRGGLGERVFNGEQPTRLVRLEKSTTPPRMVCTQSVPAYHAAGAPLPPDTATLPSLSI